MHPSAWKYDSTKVNFRFTDFSEVVRDQGARS
jgi:hypothetical protein